MSKLLEAVGAIERELDRFVLKQATEIRQHLAVIRAEASRESVCECGHAHSEHERVRSADGGSAIWCMVPNDDGIRCACSSTDPIARAKALLEKADPALVEYTLEGVRTSAYIEALNHIRALVAEAERLREVARAAGMHVVHERNRELTDRIRALEAELATARGMVEEHDQMRRMEVDEATRRVRTLEAERDAARTEVGLLKQLRDRIAAENAELRKRVRGLCKVCRGDD